MVKVRKPTKTISGVAPVAVMLPPRPCKHGACLYCPSLNAPQSYTPESPAVLRAKNLEYDPYKQVETRLKMFKEMGHPTDKVELIIMGGTFLNFQREFQFDFVKKCYDALNGSEGDSLEEAKKINETASRRCVALCIETRPDFCSDEQIEDMLSWGATRVELGVQAVEDEIYEKINRGHKVEDVVSAVRRLKRAGFKVGFHFMPGLPGSDLKRDVRMYKKLFSSKDFKPDQVKIYPCQVLKGAKLEDWYFDRKYVPYTKEELSSLIAKFLTLTPRYCRVMRIMREIPPAFLVAGVKNIDLRKDVEEKIRRESGRVEEIRFREVGFALRDGRKINDDLRFKVTKYAASCGEEYFLEIVNKDDLLFGLLRLRLEKNISVPAMVRELHVYGPALDLGKEKFRAAQHKGLGKWLMLEAEKIAKKKGRKKIKVISGVGVREYYQKLGYELDEDKVYVEKTLI